jgi:hypothetical protein
MTLDQLKKFANSSDGWVTQIALTKAAARQLIAEHEREVGKPQPGFEINTDRAETPAYAALRRASIDRMQERV